MDYSLAGQTEEGLASETRWIKGLDIINIHKEQCMVAMGHNNQKTLLIEIINKEMTVYILYFFKVESNQEENYLLNAILFGFIPILQALLLMRLPVHV